MAAAQSRWQQRHHAMAAATAIVVALMGAAPIAAAEPPAAEPQPAASPAADATASHDGRSLLPLYLSFATLQALDIESTVRVIDGGGREANPIVASVWQSTAGVTALKAATTAGLIYAAHRLKKENPKAALLLMIAANSAMATIVVRNVAIARGTR